MAKEVRLEDFTAAQKEAILSVMTIDALCAVVAAKRVLNCRLIISNQRNWEAEQALKMVKPYVRKALLS